MPKNDAGFTIAEALVATALTSIVIGSALGAFNDGMSLADTTRIVSETNQSMQAAMSLMVRDFIQVGQGIPTGGIPIPTGPGATAILRPGPPGAALTFPGAWTTLPAVSPGSNLGPMVLGVQTDAVTLLYADPTLVINTWPLVGVAGDASSMTVDARTPITGADALRPGDLILFNNANGTAMQMITRVDGTQTVFFDPADALALNQPAAAQGTLISIQSAPGAYPPTTATRISMISYYVDVVTDPALPRLVRQLNGGARLAMALGVENLQISYDLVDGTVNPTNVPEPPPANSPNQIRKANLFLSARSLDLAPRTRQFVRNSMATVVGLRSLSFVDRYK